MAGGKPTHNFVSVKGSAPKVTKQTWVSNPTAAAISDHEDGGQKVKNTDDSMTEIGSFVDPKKENELEVMAKINKLFTEAQGRTFDADVNKAKSALEQDSVIGNDEALSLNINPSTMKS